MAKKKEDRKEAQKFIAQNRKARFEYEILDKFEAGIVLQGSEVKTLRSGRASLEEAYAMLDERDELYLIHADIPEYPAASIFNHAPKRKRKLLLNKSEILKLRSKLKEKGLTIVPLSLYFKDGRVKAEIALAKGKRKFDKREAIKSREAKREMGRARRVR